MRQKIGIGIASMILLALIISFLAGADAAPTLAHNYTDIGFARACSYYDISKAANQAKFNANIATLKTNGFTERIGKFNQKPGNGNWEWELNQSYSVAIPTYENKSFDAACWDGQKNVSCIQWRLVRNGTMQETRYRLIWVANDPSISLVSSELWQHTQKLGYTRVRFCSDFTREETPEGWAISIDHVPEFAGASFSQFTWWNSTWSRKKAIEVNATDNSSLVDYQVFMNISYDSDMKTDFGDLRFLNNCSTDAIELSYCLGSDCIADNTSELSEPKNISGQYAEAFVKVPLVNSTICMYYGNPAAVTTSDANATFKLFDDFEDDSIDTGLWQNCDVSVFTEKDGRMQAVGDGGWKVCQSGINATWDDLIETIYRSPSIDNQHSMPFYTSSNRGNFYFDGGAGGDQGTLSLTPGQQLGVSKFTTHTWYNIRLYLAQNTTNNASFGGMNTTFSNETKATLNYTYYPRQEDNISFQQHSGTSNWSWYRVRKYHEPQPVYSFGPEQNNVPPSFSGYITNTTPNEDQDVMLNVTVTDNSSSVDTVIIEITNNTNSVNYTIATNVSTEWYFNLNQGNYTAHDNITWFWYANDTPGNNWNMSSQQEFIVANQNPVATILGVPANNSNESSVLVIFNWSLSTDADAEDSITYYLFINGTMNLSIPNSTNWTAINFPDAEWYWIIYADDNYTNTSSNQYHFLVDTLFAQFSSYTINATPNEDQDVMLNVTVTDDNLESVLLELTNEDSAATKNFTGVSNIGDEYYISIGPGNYTAHDNITWYWYATDSSGNLNISAQQEFTVSNQDPSIPALGIPANNTNQSAASMTFNWSLVTDADAEDTIVYYLLVNGTMNLSVPNSTNWTTISFPDGDWYWVIYADDNYTNTSSTQNRFVIDTTKPSIDIDYPVHEQHYGNATRELNFTITDALLVIDAMTFEYPNASNPSQTLNFTWFNESNITFRMPEDANETLTVYFNDTAGNLNHSTISMISDVRAPTLTNAELSPACLEKDQSRTYRWVQSDNFAQTFRESYCNWTTPSGKVYKIASSTAAVNSTAECTLNVNETGSWVLNVYVEDEVIAGEGVRWNSYSWLGTPVTAIVSTETGNYALAQHALEVVTVGSCGAEGSQGGGGGSVTFVPIPENVTEEIIEYIAPPPIAIAEIGFFTPMFVMVNGRAVFSPFHIGLMLFLGVYFWFFRKRIKLKGFMMRDWAFIIAVLVIIGAAVITTMEIEAIKQITANIQNLPNAFAEAAGSQIAAP